MAPPTDAEKHDAILVLSDPLNELVPALWIEAHRIFEEASDPLAEQRYWQESLAWHRKHQASMTKGETHHGSVQQEPGPRGD